MSPLRAVMIGALPALLALWACVPSGDVGYVEIKTVPASTVGSPSLFLDSVKLEPSRKGTAVLRQGVGTWKLQASGAGPMAGLCDVVVRKNRITSVTVSVLERPPRCLCRNLGAADRTCVS
ncbi:MAG: hypothetical protein ACLPKB_11710 [Xanthobacteraceae bacterium]